MCTDCLGSETGREAERGGGREVAIINSSGFRHYMTLSFIHARFTCTVEHSCLLVEGSLYLKPNTIEPLFFNHKNWLLNLMELLASHNDGKQHSDGKQQTTCAH